MSDTLYFDRGEVSATVPWYDQTVEVHIVSMHEDGSIGVDYKIDGQWLDWDNEDEHELGDTLHFDLDPTVSALVARIEDEYDWPPEDARWER